MIHPWPKPAPMVKQPKPLKRSRMKRRSKSAATWARQYGSSERVLWVAAQPSVWSGLGPCVNAHTERRSGLGRKGHYTSIVPMTDGEHDAYDQHRAPFDVEENRRKVEAWAPIIEQRWQEHSCLLLEQRGASAIPESVLPFGEAGQ